MNNYKVNKLSPEDLKMIQGLVEKGVTLNDIAKLYQLSDTTISRLRKADYSIQKYIEQMRATKQLSEPKGYFVPEVEENEKSVDQWEIIYKQLTAINIKLNTLVSKSEKKGFWK